MPSYLYSEEAAARIAAYRPDIKLLLCLRPPAEMIYSWYWFNRNAVVASLPESFEEMMENPFLRDLGCFARHLKPYLDRFPAENILVVQFDAIRRDPDRVRQRDLRIFGGRRGLQTAALPAGKERRPGSSVSPSPIQRSASLRRPLRSSGRGKLLKSPSVARTLQSVYTGFNTKARNTSRSRRKSVSNGRPTTRPIRKSSPTYCGVFGSWSKRKHARFCA